MKPADSLTLFVLFALGVSILLFAPPPSRGSWTRLPAGPTVSSSAGWHVEISDAGEPEIYWADGGRKRDPQRPCLEVP